MRERNYLTILIAFLIMSVCNDLFSQVTNVTGKYIVINSIDEFISEQDGLVIAENFNIYNFPEGESSKPSFIAVTELSGVVKFSIESSSSTHVGQRRCRLVLKEEGWEYTLRNAFHAIKIEYILVNEQFVELNDYFNSLK